MDSKQILTLNKRQSIVQRIDAMKASFSANKIKDKLSRYHYFGYPSQILIDKLISKIPSNTVDKNSVIAVINDFGLEVISQLQLLGYTNLILLCTESDDKLYNIIKYMVEKEFNFTNIERLQDMNNTMNDKFDLVIANPPYEIGNAVITETMKHCEEAVVLMPASKYKKDLFNFVFDCVDVDASLFDSCAIPGRLSICCLNKNSNVFKSYDAFLIETTKSNLKPLLQYNIDKRDIFKYSAVNCNRESVNISPEDTFLLGCLDTDLSTGRWAYEWNVLKNASIIDRDGHTSKNGILSCIFFTFNSSQEKENFTAWIYGSVLMNMFFEAYSKEFGGGTHWRLLFPRIDWSRTDVEYTDEYVLEQMGLKWNENKDGVEKL